MSADQASTEGQESWSWSTMSFPVCASPRAADTKPHWASLPFMSSGPGPLNLRASGGQNTPSSGLWSSQQVRRRSQRPWVNHMSGLSSPFFVTQHVNAPAMNNENCETLNEVMYQ